MGLIGLVVYILIVSHISPPSVPNVEYPDRIQVSDNHFKIGPNYLKKSELGIWEMYIEGDPYERGLIYGALSKELCQKQEEIFVDQINDFVPNPWAQQGLRMLLGYFNKDLTNHIPLEYQQEIYGVSRSFSDKYDFIAPKYMRILNYHAAHDIGHALNDYSMVGCSSFGVKGSKTNSGNLLVGRNFDFYVGDEFAQEKLILMVKPKSGYGFCTYSWAGFMGVASGMNEKGLSVTINASKSDLPKGTKMPVSLLAREILQYASTLEEAIAIAKKRDLFVSETIMVGSKTENSVVLIEKSPTEMGVYRMNSDQIICTNHYQSNTFESNTTNVENINESDSKYRFDRITELLGERPVLDVQNVADILRDQKGKNNDTLGMGNPKAINQMIGHHSCVFDYTNNTFYISTQNWQLGAFVGYDIVKSIEQKSVVRSASIPKDPFLHSPHFEQFQIFRSCKKKIDRYLLFDVALQLSSEEIEQFIQSNQESYVTYELLAKYFNRKGNTKKAITFYELALSKELPSIKVKKELEQLKNTLK